MRRVGKGSVRIYVYTYNITTYTHTHMYTHTQAAQLIGLRSSDYLQHATEVSAALIAKFVRCSNYSATVALTVAAHVLLLTT